MLSVGFSVPLKNKLLVPIYLRLGTSVGYNDNIFKFSSSEKNNIDSYNYMGSSSNYDSSIIKPEFRLSYSPKLFKNNISNFVLYTSSSNYPSVVDKNGLYMSLRFEYKIGPYNWIKFGYKNSANNFLRFYSDDDIPGNDYLKCNYDSESVFFSYSMSLKPYGWVKFGFSKGTQLFNPNFTEFDLEINTVDLKYYFNFNDFSYSLSLKNDNANNFTYANGLNSTAFDRSYNSSSIAFKVGKMMNKYLKKINFGYGVTKRSYVSEALSDPLHSGRSHYEQFISLSLLKELRNDISIELKYRIRNRQTNSEFDWVEALKSFSDNQVMVKVIYYTELDLFY
jgi:hypothetical protein